MRPFARSSSGPSSGRMDPFGRADPSDDARFYSVPRKVVHIEQGAIEALRSTYASLLPAGADVLDLMTSWRSHLPEGVQAVGLGMNADEMADNPQLTSYVVQDLNREPTLPYADTSFDAVVCAVSVQYLTRPIEVFSEVRRVLRPGGVVVVSFSNRCFPTKAVAIWVAGGDDHHRNLVRTYLEEAGFADVEDEEVRTTDDPLFVVRATKAA